MNVDFSPCGRAQNHRRPQSGTKCQGTTSVVPIQPIISIGALAPVMLHDSFRKRTKCQGTDLKPALSGAEGCRRRSKMYVGFSPCGRAQNHRRPQSGTKCQGTTSVVPIQPIISIGALAPVMLHESFRKRTKCQGTDLKPALSGAEGCRRCSKMNVGFSP